MSDTEKPDRKNEKDCFIFEQNDPDYDDEEDVDQELQKAIDLEIRYETETDALCNFKRDFEQYLYDNGLDKLSKDLKIKNINLFLSSLKKK